MTPDPVKSIRALERGLQVLNYLREQGGVTLHELHEGLDLPKATLLRLLRTLEANGFVWRGLSDGRYRAGQLLHRLGETPSPHDRLVEAAGPILDQLVSKVQWPSDMSVRQGTWMAVCETSRQRSYFTLDRVVLGFRVNTLLSAPGRAYLAFCPPAECESLLNELRLANDPGYLHMNGAQAIQRMLSQTRAQGYAVREASWGGHFSQSKREYDDGLAAIAVPILDGAAVLGCLNLIWLARVTNVGSILRDHLDDLQAASRLISANYQARRPQA